MVDDAMKRFPVLILILISLAMPAAAKPAVGYSIAPVGEMGANGAFGALNLAFMVSMESSVHAGDIELSVNLSTYGRVFQGADLRVSTPLFAVTDHPFNALFPNTMMWAPKLSVGALFRMPDDWNVTIGLSPFAFHDTDYVFEFFSPYILYSITHDKWGWGMYVVRFSYFFGEGGR